MDSQGTFHVNKRWMGPQSGIRDPCMQVFHTRVLAEWARLVRFLGETHIVSLSLAYAPRVPKVPTFWKVSGLRLRAP